MDVQREDKTVILEGNLPFESFMETLIKNSQTTDGLLDIYKGAKPNKNHRLMAKLARIGKLKTIVTTNFDQLIEIP